MSSYQRVKSRLAGFWKESKRSARSVAALSTGVIVLALVIAFLVGTIPSNLSNDLTLGILNALLTSGTVFLPLAGVVITFSLGSAKSHVESLRRDRLAVWIAQQEAYVKAIIENKPDSSTAVAHQFGPAIEKQDAEIASLERNLKRLGWLSIFVFAIVLLQILVSLRAMAEVSPQQSFPYVWAGISIALLAMALYGLAILVYEATGIGRSGNRE